MTVTGEDVTVVSIKWLLFIYFVMATIVFAIILGQSLNKRVDI